MNAKEFVKRRNCGHTVSIPKSGLLSQGISGKNVPERGEIRREAMVFQDCLGVVGLFNRQNSGFDGKYQNAGSVQHASVTMPRQRFSAKFLLLIGRDEPFATFRETQTRGLAST
jgi:hypothetical protein